MDESGDLGFGCGTKFFVLAFVAPKVGLGKAIKNFNAHLIRNGWNREVEIKATNLWHAPRNASIPDDYAYKRTPEVPMRSVLESISAVDQYIEYAAVKLDTISTRLQTAPCAILYNHFSWQLLKGPLCYYKDVELFTDRRNREYHRNLKFDGYIEGKAGLARASLGKEPLNLVIHHYHSDSSREFSGAERAAVEGGVRGLEAADFVCWAIKKKFENGDDQWLKIIEGKIRWRQHLYRF
jgi:hypothetical protein